MRDPKTNAILNVDMNEYNKYMSQRQEKQVEEHRIEKIESEVSEIKSNLNEIKDLLKNLSKWFVFEIVS